MAEHTFTRTAVRANGTVRGRLERGPLKHRALAWGKLLAGPLLVASVLCICFAAWSIWRFGTWTDGIAYIYGHPLAARQTTLHLGQVRVGEQVDCVFVLKNLWDEPITVVGASPDCSCVETMERPLKIAPRVPASFEVMLTPRPNEAGKTVTHRILLHLDVDAPPMVLSLVADVPPEESQVVRQRPKETDVVKVRNNR